MELLAEAPSRGVRGSEQNKQTGQQHLHRHGKHRRDPSVRNVRHDYTKKHPLSLLFEIPMPRNGRLL